jgi:nucleoid-associated protein YgaU
MPEPQLQRLRITIVGSSAAAVAQQIGVPVSFEVQLNPTEYSVEKGSTFAEIAVPGLELPLVQFVHGNSEQLQLELLFDVTKRDRSTQNAPSDVRELTGRLERLARIVPRTHAPPRIEVSWGGVTPFSFGGFPFQAVIERVQQRFTLFSPAGVPLRARVTVGLRRYESLSTQLKRLKLESADHTKTWRVRRGDSLAGIAFHEYGDARLWRHIADAPANARVIGNPRRLRPGAVLALPPLPAGPAERAP